MLLAMTDDARCLDGVHGISRSMDIQQEEAVAASAAAAAAAEQEEQEEQEEEQEEQEDFAPLLDRIDYAPLVSNGIVSDAELRASRVKAGGQIITNRMEALEFIIRRLTLEFTWVASTALCTGTPQGSLR